MPVIVDPDSTTARRLLGALPPGCQSVDTTERLLPWLSPVTWLGVLAGGALCVRYLRSAIAASRRFGQRWRRASSLSRR